jgi:hypothetical protein
MDHSSTQETPLSHNRKHALVRCSIRLALSLALALVATARASAQYPGGGGGTGTGSTGPGYTPPSNGYGSGKAIGIAAGAAAGVGVLFLALHHGAVTGCVRPTSDGLRLVDEKKNKSYVIAPGSIALKPGEVVRVQGKRSTDHDGASSFQAKKVVKSLGTCTVDSSLTPAQSASQ